VDFLSFLSLFVLPFYFFVLFSICFISFYFCFYLFICFTLPHTYIYSFSIFVLLASCLVSLFFLFSLRYIYSTDGTFFLVIVRLGMVVRFCQEVDCLRWTVVRFYLLGHPSIYFLSYSFIEVNWELLLSYLKDCQ
jgi:hypothetical protein